MKADKINIAGTQYDRRVKLTEQQKKEIRELYATGGYTQAALANMYEVSNRLISFAIYPEKYEKAREQFKERRKDGRYKQSKDKRREIMREIRQYKRELYESKNI